MLQQIHLRCVVIKEIALILNLSQYSPRFKRRHFQAIPFPVTLDSVNGRGVIRLRIEFPFLFEKQVPYA